MKQKSIFLAEVSDDIYTNWEEVKRCLVQADINILPKHPYYFQSPHEYKKALLQDIKESQLFIQLLGVFPCTKFDISDYSNLQFQCAQETNTQIIQWCNFDFNSLHNHDYKKIFQSKDLIKGSLEEFKSNLLERIHTDASIFINANVRDENIAEDVKILLNNNEIIYNSLLWQDKSKDILRKFERYIKYCDGFIMVLVPVPLFGQEINLEILKNFCPNVPILLN